MLSESQQKMLYEAHGSMAALTWGFIFPLGAIMIRLVPSTKAWIIHGGIMLLGLLLFTSAVGIGLNRVPTLDEKIGTAAHYIIGITLFSMIWAQAILGYVHHYVYKHTGSRSFTTTVHVFFGRVLMLVGIVNGGVGLLKAGYSSRAENIAYGVVVAIIWVTYILTSLWFEAGRVGKAIPSSKSAGSSDMERTSREDTESKGATE